MFLASLSKGSMRAKKKWLWKVPAPKFQMSGGDSHPAAGPPDSIKSEQNDFKLHKRQCPRKCPSLMVSLCH